MQRYCDPAVVVDEVWRRINSPHLVSHVLPYLWIVSSITRWYIVPCDCLALRNVHHVHVSHPLYFAPQTTFQIEIVSACIHLVKRRWLHESIYYPLHKKIKQQTEVVSDYCSDYLSDVNQSSERTQQLIELQCNNLVKRGEMLLLLLLRSAMTVNSQISIRSPKTTTTQRTVIE